MQALIQIEAIGIKRNQSPILVVRGIFAQGAMVDQDGRDVLVDQDGRDRRRFEPIRVSASRLIQAEIVSMLNLAPLYSVMSLRSARIDEEGLQD